MDLRERALQQEVTSLGIARMSERAAADHESECRKLLLQAEQERRELSGVPASVLRYIELEDWLETLGIKHAQAAHSLRLARAEMERAKERVRQAQVSLKQVEMLMERIAKQEREAERRRERRVEDEVSMQLLSFRRGR